MATYWVKEESFFLPRAQLMKKLVKKLTVFLSELLLPLHLKFPRFMHQGLPVGFSTFLQPLFHVTLTHAPFDKILVKHSLALSLYFPFFTFYSVAMLSASIHSPGGVTPMSQTLLCFQ
jgi:hypothetical protein